MKYAITKGYKVYQGAVAGEPMDETTEQNLYAWLVNRGLSDKQALELIRRVDKDQIATVEIPISS